MSVETEGLRVVPGLGMNTCGVHRGELAPSEERLMMRLSDGDGGEFDVTICRSCLSEHMPTFLDEITRDLSIG